MRFILYAVAAMSLLEYFLFIRGAVIWENRNYSSVGPVRMSPVISFASILTIQEQYLGPSVWQLLHLFLLTIANTVTLFALGILLVRVFWSLGANTTTIEVWEIERHEALRRRARAVGGYLTGPTGIQVKIIKQEFPYDIGIWQNLVQSMGSTNV